MRNNNSYYLQLKTFLLSAVILIIIFTQLLPAQNNLSVNGSLSIERFYDSAHHWYDIKDENKIINPLPEKPRYNKSDFINIAENILLFQKTNGGWAKNYDMLAILTEEQKEIIAKHKNDLNTSFDNGTTFSQSKYLAEVFTITKNGKYKTAFLKSLDFILDAQYSNGGWPQFFPDTSGYQKYITFNDGAMIGIMNLLKNIIDGNENFSFLNKDYIERVNNAFNKGLNCILNCQIRQDDGYSVWCQQHDNITLEPRGARTFEPPAICNEESSEIVLFLMSIKNPDEKIIQSIKSAVNWFEKSKISGVKTKIIDAPAEDYKYHTTTKDVIIVEDKNAPPIWTRFNDIQTQQPIFCRRDGKIVYSLSEVERERRTGYGWYTYEPQKVLDYYNK